MTQPTRTAIVTGAARGIGKAVAIRLSSDGFRVAVVDLDEAACGPSTVESGRRARDDVARPLVGHRREEICRGEASGEALGGVLLTKATDLDVASGGDAEVAVSEVIRGLGEDLRLVRREEPTGETDAGEVPVGGRMETQRAGAPVTPDTDRRGPRGERHAARISAPARRARGRSGAW